VYHLSYHDEAIEAIDTLKRVKEIIEAPAGSVDTLIEQVSLYYKKTR
jgi:hypothetical protein